MAISEAAASFLRGRIKLRHLRLMLILDEERSISRAAERLCISQAAVSKTRAEIEDGVGAPLFTRVNRRLELTETGECVLQSARRIIAELQNLGDEVAVMKSGMRGTVTIGTRSVSAEPFLAYVAAKFKETNPNVIIRLIDSDLPFLLERLGKGEMSLLVGRLDSEHIPEHLDTQVILADRNVVIASPTHPLLKRTKLEWPEIIRHRWCLSPSGFAGRFSREHLASHLRHLNLPFPNDLIEPTSFGMHITLMQAGDFLTLMPQGVAYELEQRGVAFQLKLPPIGTADPVCLMWRSDMPLSPAAKRFRDFTVNAIKTAEGAQMLTVKPRGPAVGRRFGYAGPIIAGRAQKRAPLHRAGAGKARRLSSA